MKKFNQGRWRLGIALGLVGGVTAIAFGSGCESIPRRQLSAEEKLADLAWVYSQFGQYYAPLEYKQQRYQFKYNELKAQYNTEAIATKNNDEFYSLLKRFVSEFKDAHTSSSLAVSDLPGRARVAYLGFSGVRSGSKFLVKELFPTVAQSANASSFPVQPGAEITHINGIPLIEAVRSQSWIRDLGQDEANLTFHMNRLFTRLSIDSGLPSESMVTLRLASGQEVMLPWIVRDTAEFEAAQKAAQGDSSESHLASFSLLGFDGQILALSELHKWLERGQEGFDSLRTFRFVDAVHRWTTQASADQSGDRLAQMRDVPAGAIRIADAQIYPAYIYRIDQRMIGYIWLSTFSPRAPEGAVLAEFQQTLDAFKSVGVQELIIDTIDNGGGSLSLGMALAQKLSNEKVKMPEIQLVLSDTWLDEFDHRVHGSGHDAYREMARRMLAQLESERQEGKRLSSRFPTEILLAQPLAPNATADSKLRVAVLVNEMCASMCDIFAGIVQDNRLGKIIGSRTMGAGGNVVEHKQAPNTHLDLRQTESLLVRQDGTYLENNGVTPDVLVNVSEAAALKYRVVRQEAEKVLAPPVVVATHP